MNRNGDEGFAAYFASRSSPMEHGVPVSRRGFFHREEPTAEHTDRSRPEQGNVKSRTARGLAALRDAIPATTF